MGKNIVARGSSVKEAVSKALELLSANKDEVDIEILENEKKGILGMLTKPAVVRVMIKERAPALVEAAASVSSTFEEETVSLKVPDDTPIFPISKSGSDAISAEDDLWGKVWVIDGQIMCKDAPDKYPLVSPAKGMTLYMNDDLVEKTVIISENDILQVELQDEVLEPTWEMNISDNKMEAVLTVKPGMRILRRLKNKPPNNYVQLEIEEKHIPVIIDTGPIMVKLKELGIAHGVDYTEIARACTTEEAGSFIIAKGTLATTGKHGYFHPVQQVDIKKGLKERSDGTIDYREIQQFPSVDRGQIIGVVQPPEPGFPGVSVTNEPVFPLEVYPLTVKIGKGAELAEDGTKVVATDAGHPEVKVKGTLAHISVIPKLLIRNDISLETGNVRYIGDVEIIGSVQDGMIVDARGNLTVHHNVNMANICSGNSIIVQNNIIASEVTAGKSNLLNAELSQLLGELIEQMNQMVVAIKQLSTVSAFKVSSFTRTGLGPLIKILCEGKFKSFPVLTAALIKKVKSGSDILGEQWVELSARMHNSFINVYSSDLRSEEDILKLIKQVEQLYVFTRDTDVEENSFIKAGFVHNSQIYSSGDIMITGQGIYNSKLHAGGFVEVVGFVRGGEIYAAKGAQINEAGTKGGLVTKIVVPKSETIKIKMAMEDTVIQIGDKMHKFMTRTWHVHAKLNESGELIIS